MFLDRNVVLLRSPPFTLFWLFSLGECKNLPAWNSHLRGVAGGCTQYCHLAEVLCNCLILSPLLSSSSFLSFHFFHFFSLMLTFFISNSPSCVLLSLSFESKLPVPYLIPLSVQLGVTTQLYLLVPF